MLAGVPSLPLPLALPGHLFGSLDESLSGCSSLDLLAELLRGLGLQEALVIAEPCPRCQKLCCHGPVSMITRPASPWIV